MWIIETKFIGRNAGSIGIMFPIEFSFTSQAYLTKDEILSFLYAAGYEHISGVMITQKKSLTYNEHSLE